MPTRAGFAAELGFELDEFQRRALDALDAGGSVVVAAPTGSGKTVVAAVRRGPGPRRRRPRPSTPRPLKALSNQKYGELVRRHGPEAVGLLTGDNAINGNAPVVVMTTEVLRNMIYASSPALAGLRYVILDEVHYLQNAYRGPVWEEVIIHAPPRGGPGVPVGHGLQRRGARRLDPHRPGDDDRRHRGSPAGGLARPVPAGRQGLASGCCCCRPSSTAGPTLRRPPSTPRPCAIRGCGAGPGAGCSPPGGSRSLELLDEHDMLPAIYFIFSRAACDDAVAQCVREGKRLTTVGGAPPDPGHRRGPRRGAVRRRPARARLRRLADRPGGGLRRPPRRPGPALQGGGRGLLRGRSGQGGVRHRDPVARHQHAGPLGGDREAHQVHRRTPRVPHAGGVHPAHRSGRPARHRRGRLRRGPVVALRALRPGGRAGRGPHLRPDAAASAPPTTWPPTWCAATPRRGPPPAQPVLRPVPGRQRRRPPRDPAGAHGRGAGRGPASWRPATGATSRSTAACCGPARSRPGSGRP